MVGNLIIIDTETTGFDPAADQVIEVGAILYSVQFQSIITQLSFLVSAPDNPAEHINNIPPGLLKDRPKNMQVGYLNFLQALAAQADYAIAHNAEFDQQWFDGHKMPVLFGCDHKPIQWLCTMADMTWPRQAKARESLVNLALQHGIGVASAHRALADCQLIAELFNRVTQDELHGLIQQALRPKSFYRADVSYEDRHLAKAAGFQWNPDGKYWGRWMADEDAADLPFRVWPLPWPANLAC